MLAGHYAPALFLKKSAPELPLWVLCLAVQAVDIGYMALVLVTMGRLRLLGVALVGLQLVNDLVLPMDTNLHLLAIKALGLYFGVATLAWWLERPRARPGNPAATPNG